MPSSPDMLTAALEINRRHARLAVTWFAVDPVQVERVLRAAQERVGRGEASDFLGALQDARVLTGEQAQRLRTANPPTEDFVIGAGEPDTDKDPVTKLDAVDGAEGLTQMSHYRILRKLGQGGMGAVYLAFDAKENRQVALKVLAADQAPKQNVLRRFQLEGQNGALLVHPNIIRSYHHGQDAATNLHYIVLEYVDGRTAHDLLERTGKLRVGDAVHIILDIARALEHAHKNQIIHRDIKPANILVTASGLAKLSDLGLAKRRDDSANLTNASQGIGTPYYMPYEQAMNAKRADERSDIYALGATLYHLLTGEVPFPGESAVEIVEKKGVGVYPPAHTLNPDVPEKLDAILAHMMARDPHDRYQTASEVIVDLDRAQLAAAIPSFVNVDTALEDPVIMQRLTTPVQPTQADMNLHPPAVKDAPDQLWYLKYRDQRGNLCKAKATTAEILDRLKKGTIPLHTEASRSPQGKFKALERYPEFQQITAIAPVAKKVERRAEPKPTVSNTGWQPWLLLAAAAALGIGVIVILLVTLVVYINS
ncbi:MAG: serine/threonine protein kinase [Planctomycetes bacterium]|nr:serine/threonine protein kinase [Planctomycetota bacterium]